MHNMCVYAKNGDKKDAEIINNRLDALHDKLFIESNPIPVKWVLNRMGLIKKGIRLPLTWMDAKFEKSLEALGKKLIECKQFRDHHAYTEQDFIETESNAVFMTEKDAVKCQQFAKNNWYYLKVDATPTKELIEQINQLLKQKGITHGI